MKSKFGTSQRQITKVEKLNILSREACDVFPFQSSLSLYQAKLGMKLLSIQDVSQYGFCLYFLGFTTDSPPDPQDLHSVSNREWLWQRPYTTLEIQHMPGARPCVPMTEEGEGVDHVGVEVGEEVYNKVVGDLGLEDDGKYQDCDGVKLTIRK